MKLTRLTLHFEIFSEERNTLIEVLEYYLKSGQGNSLNVNDSPRELLRDLKKLEFPKHWSE